MAWPSLSAAGRRGTKKTEGGGRAFGEREEGVTDDDDGGGGARVAVRLSPPPNSEGEGEIGKGGLVKGGGVGVL